MSRALAVVALIVYPVLVWFGLTHGSPRRFALVLLCILLPLVALRFRSATRGVTRGLAAVPLVTVAALGLAAALDASGFMLVVPVAISGLLLLGFGATLRRNSTPMIERFARLQVSELSPEQRAWCRLWTCIWCGFFVVNGATALALALAAPLSWWAVYTGLVAYGLMGVLFATEWVLRRRRFGAIAVVLREDGAGDERLRDATTEPGTPVEGAVRELLGRPDGPHVSNPGP